MLKNLMKKVMCMVMTVFVLAGVVSISADAVEEKQSLFEVPGGYELMEMGKLYKDGKLEIVAGDSEVTVKSDKASGGMIISGIPSEIEKISVLLKDEVDFGAYTAGRIVVNALSEEEMNISVNACLDDENTISIPSCAKEEGTSWTGEKNNCADISGLNAGGKHKLSLSMDFEDDTSEQVANIMLKNILFVAYSVPVIDLNIDESLGSIADMNSDFEHKTRCYGNMTISIPEGYESEYTDEKLESQTYELDYIRGRGNSTWWAEKKPYKIKLKEKAGLLGMGKNKHWGLLANYYDYSMLRNKYTYWLGAKMGMEFTLKCVFVDVVMNGSYLGSYCLSELVRTGKNRVNIDELDETVTDGVELTGGYILGVCSEETEEINGFSMIDELNSSYELYFTVEFPELDEVMVWEQFDYIKGYIEKVNEIIYSDDLCDENGISYREYIDVNSMIDYYAVEGTSANWDAFRRGSTYMYKKRDGKLYFGPLWDFDYAAWNAVDFEEDDNMSTNYDSYLWLVQLYNMDEEFREQLIKRIGEVNSIIRESALDGEQLDIYAKELYLSQKANHSLIPSVLTRDVYDGTHYNDFDNEVERFRRYISERADWQDENSQNLVADVKTAKFFVDGEEYYSFLFSQWEFDISRLPNEPVAEGKDFAGWFIKTSDGEPIPIVEYMPDEDETELNFYAEFTEKEQPSKEPSEQHSEQPSEQSSEQPSKELSEQPSKEPSEQPSEQSSKQAVKEQSEKSVLPSDTKAVSTGENDMTAFWIFSALISCCTCVMLMFDKRKLK